MMKTIEIRQKFLDFFAELGHKVVSSSSLVPNNDPSLLFTNAGMNQFKDVFLGLDTRPYHRAVSAQKCMRAGGKHNDLENVGYTARHHTFFEMLGNFSFGDYFKREALSFAWAFLTDRSKLAIPSEKLIVTVYASDDEAYDIWAKDIGLAPNKIIRIGDNKGAPYASDNFWQMGDTGPCGPCSEIFYDHGAAIFGGPPASPDEDGERFIEIWNCVFMQFNRDEQGVLHPLPKPSVDTGMGLERIAAVMQNVHSNYEIDTFQALIMAAAHATQSHHAPHSPSLKVIADHIRACSFLIADGVLPSNEGRGYVLRRIMRRAIRHGYKLGQKNAFFFRLVNPLVAQMGEAYPELVTQQAHIEDILKEEESRFADTLEHGMALLENTLANGQKTLDGATLFRLYDTFGFPVDLTCDICRERGVAVDMATFEEAMNAQRTRARQASHFKLSEQLNYQGENTSFLGYEHMSLEAKITALYRQQQAVTQLDHGEEGVVILDKTPFYAESGGQVGDQGEISSTGGLDALFDVVDTQKIQKNVFAHQGRLTHGHIKVGDLVTATVDLHCRHATARHHSATHLLHAALRRVLGPHVHQKGSLVNSQRTRFDFAHTAPVSQQELAEIERIVNHVIMQNIVVSTQIIPYDDALRLGAIALFDEKYDEQVRVLQMGDFSIELCGGTHINRTGEIGFFKIVAESGIAAGIRRIEAQTGEAALHFIQAQDQLIKNLGIQLKTSQDLPSSIEALQDNIKTLEKENKTLKQSLVKHSNAALLDQVSDLGGVHILIAELPNADNETLRRSLDTLKDTLKTAVILLASRLDARVLLVAGVSADLMSTLPANELVNYAAHIVGGKGGGRADMAQAGGTNSDKLPQALTQTRSWIEQKLMTGH